MPAKPFDYAKNLANPAVASAAAACRREARKAGNAYRVEWSNAGGAHYWEGCRYDALGLAKDLAGNPGSRVALFGPDGREIVISSARY